MQRQNNLLQCWNFLTAHKIYNKINYAKYSPAYFRELTARGTSIHIIKSTADRNVLICQIPVPVFQEICLFFYCCSTSYENNNLWFYPFSTAAMPHEQIDMMTLTFCYSSLQFTFQLEQNFETRSLTSSS